MKFVTRLLILLSLSQAPSAFAEGDLSLLTLGTNVTASYGADRSARIEGGSIAHIECIFAQLELPYQIIHMPWRRAHQEVHKQSLDGFFTAILVEDADDQGVLSDPLVLENWYWFTPVAKPLPDSWSGHKIGAIIGSPQAIWLARQGYPEPVAANNLPQLVKMLMSGRIDVVLADKEQFEKVATELGIATSQYTYRFYRYMPLGVYFSRAALAERNDFLAQFNRRIFACAPDAFQVSEYEREKIKEQLMPLMMEWIQRPGVISAVVEQNRVHRRLSLDELLQRDQQWQALFYQGYSPLAQALHANPLSTELRELKATTGSLVSEIIVMDERGFNVGVSDMTSDYWQGDEDKYLQVFGRPKDTLLFDAVVFDESTRRFQAQLSLQIYKPGIPQVQGVLTLGVNIEKALSLSD